MKVKLTKGNIWYLIPTMGKWTSKEIYYPEDTPSHIIDYLNKQECVELKPISEWSVGEEDIVVEYPRSFNGRWPTEEETKTEEVTVFIDCNNFDSAMQGKRGRKLVTNDKGLTGFRNIKFTDEIPFNTVVYPDTEEPYKADDSTEDIYILQFLKLFSSEEKIKTSNYRRFKLRNFLAKRYGAHFKSLVNFNELKKDSHYPVLLISTSLGWEAIAENCTYDLLVYDRTDNWGALSEDNREEEDKLIKKADIVFNSAQFLFEDSKSKRKMYQQTYFIPNGCDVKEYKPVEKYPYPTAAYIGKSTGKIDWEKIKEVSKDYKVLLYGDFNQIPDDLGVKVEYRGYLDEYTLHEELCKCHVGLIPFTAGDWTRGMLPLKLFHYANAHIPTLYWNCPECDNYPTIASSTEVLNPTDEDFDNVMATANWNAKFKVMQRIIKDNMKGFAIYDY